MSSSNEHEAIEDLLVAYALGMLEPAEMQHVSSLLVQRPELHQVLAELRSVVALLPHGLPDAVPAADLRARVLQRATGKSERPGPFSADAAGSQRNTRTGRGWLRLPWIGAFSAALAVVVLALIFTFQPGTPTTQPETLAKLLATPGAQVFVGENASGRATFVRAPQQGGAVVTQLPPLAAGRTYQLWLVTDTNQPPTSAGVFDVDESGRGVLLLSNNQLGLMEARAFAITNEPDGGSPRATTDIIVSGDVAS